MARFYKTGRDRTIRQQVTVSVQGTYRGLGSDAGTSTTLGPGDSYSVTSASLTGPGAASWIAYSSGFGVTPAYGESGTFGLIQRVVGVRVRSKTGNGFVPLAVLPISLFAVQASINASAVINRVMQLFEVFDHDNNGQRRDMFGPSGTCYETYTVDGGGTFTSRDGGDMLYRQSPPALTDIGTTFPVCFGLVEGGIATASAGGNLYSAGAALTWSFSYLDESGDPVPGNTPDAPSHSTVIGSSSWGSLVANAPGLPGFGTQIKREVRASWQWLPRHSFEVTMRPLEIPTGAPIVQQHRLAVDFLSLPGVTRLPISTSYVASGETVAIPCGGMRWVVSHQGAISSPLGLSSEAGLATTYNSLLAPPTRFRVLHNDNQGHYNCHIREPYDVLGLDQDNARDVPGGAGLAVPASGFSTYLGVGQEIGYRYLRVRAKTPTGTGTLTVESYLDDALINPTATKTLTTTAPNTTATIEIDLLEVAGCTYNPRLTLDELVFSASGNAFDIEALELFRKDASHVVSLSPYRALPPIEEGLDVSWLEGYTDGVESLRMIATGGSKAEVKSTSIRQLVAEINGTTRHSYPALWSSGGGAAVLDTGAAGIPSPLLGWSAVDLAVPRVGKDYNDSDALFEVSDFADSDIYVSGLHGDGVIAGSLLVGIGPGTIRAQRYSFFAQPGTMPGPCGYDGTSIGNFGPGGVGGTCPIVFTGLFRGVPIGMTIPPASLPVEEVSITTGTALFPSTMTYPVPVPKGRFLSQEGSFAVGTEGVNGFRNYGNGQSAPPGYRLVTTRIDNAGGTPAETSFAPYHREHPYNRLWAETTTTDKSALCVDSVHGWLHVGKAAAVQTFSSASSGANLIMAFESSPWPGVEYWAAMACDERLHRLFLLARLSAGGFALYRSQDGGRSGEEILTMTGNSGSLVVSSEHQSLIVLVETTGGTVERRLSKDGGDTWETVVTARSGAVGGALANLNAEVLSMSCDPRLGGALFALIKLSDGTQKVLRSTTLGRQWEEVA